MNSFPEAIRFLYDLQKGGMKFGLRGVRSLLAAVGNPHRSLACIHVAGSNGKGSTASLLAAILAEGGYKTGLYTSPHLINFTERIRVNGKVIPQHSVVHFVRKLRHHIRKTGATFFEAATALAFLHFAEEQVDVVVLETGLGGRLDATNVVKPVLSVITTVSREHTHILGSTIPRIAFEKAGIIKPGVPCVTGALGKALEVIRKVAKRRGASLRTIRGARTVVRSATLAGTVLDISINSASWNRLSVSLPGKHQIRNVLIALMAIEELRKNRRFRIPDQAIRAAVRNVEEATGLRGRLSVIQDRKRILLDVAHNPAAVDALVECLNDLRIKGVTLVFGVMQDKDYVSMIRSLKKITSRVIVATPRTERARAGTELANEFARQGMKATDAGGVPEAIAAAQRGAGRRTVLVTGSHFLVGEALAFLEGKKYLTINQ